MTLVARAVAPAPFDATPDGPTCAAELIAHKPRSGSLPGDQLDQYCEVRLAAKANDDTGGCISTPGTIVHFYT